MKTESKATHTPGPWRIGDAGRTVFGAKVPGAMPATVAYMPPITPRVDAGERKANRLLMAAAPELLAACRSLMRAEGMQRGDRDGCTMGEISQAIDAARAAIAKALGNV